MTPSLSYHLRAALVCLGALGPLLVSGAASAAEPLPQAHAAADTSDPWYIGFESELTWNYSLAQINAPAAYGRGLTGAGQVVAVFDSGIDATDNQFTGRIKPNGYDAYTGEIGAVPEGQWHGTFVSGIIAANRDAIGMVGVAYDAQILPIRVVDGDGAITLSDSQLSHAIYFATLAGARVFNNSWNTTAPIQAFTPEDLRSILPETLRAYRTAVRAGAIVVFAAGNEGQSEPGLYAALPLYYPSLEKGWLAAVATDASGVIAGYSNRCGAAAAWCMAAPGSDIISVYQGGYGIASGTSFATANLSAAAAILKQMFPYLQNEQILQILFRSANKSGIYADSTVYGQGLLDLEAATRPIGPLQVASLHGSPVPLQASAFWLSPAFGRGFVRSLADQPVVAQDEFGRGYEVGMASLVASPASLFDVMDDFDRFGGDMDTLRRGNAVLSYRLGSDGKGAVRPERFLIEQDTGTAFAAAAYHIDPSFALAAQDQRPIARGDLVFDAASAVPYLSLAQNAVAVAYGNRWGEATALRVGAFSGEVLSAPARAEDFILPQGLRETANVSGVAATLELSPQPGLALALDGGVVVEHATVLGAMYRGAAAFGENTPTYYTGLTGSLRLGPSLSLAGAAHLGLTEPAISGTSLITAASRLMTTSFHLALAKENLRSAGDRAGVVLSQPLRVVSGSAALVLPTTIDLAGQPIYSIRNASLKADGQELDVQGFYMLPLAPGEHLNFGAMIRLEPDNVAGAAPQAILMTRYRASF